MTTRTAFVLTGGGSLGAVQVGMLQALEEHGVAPDLLAGTSAGALNAAWVAGHGTSAESLTALAELWTQVRRAEVFPVTLCTVWRALIRGSGAVSSGAPLGRLVRHHAGIRDLEEAVVPTVVMASDVLTGLPVALDRGPLDTAVRASAAIPGIFPPVLVRGRWLVDGGVAQAAGVAHAVAGGATEVYVLPSGYPCALPHPPTTPIGMALHAFTLLLHQRLVTEVTAARLAGAVEIHVLPPLCPLSVSAADFTRAAELTSRGREAAAAWLRSGRTAPAHPERVLSLHEHGEESVSA
jgi:NTE family protein